MIGERILQHQLAFDDLRSKFDDRKLLTLPLSRMHRFHQMDYWPHTIKWMLQNRIQIDIDKDSIVPTNKRVWQVKDHFLDFTLKTSDGIGLSAWIPNVATSHTWEINLDLNRPYHAFKAKRGQLGFSRQNAMLWCGRAPNGEDLYLCLVDKSYLDGNTLEDDSAADSCIKHTHYYMLLHFLGSMLARNPDKSVTIFVDYPDDPC